MTATDDAIAPVHLVLSPRDAQFVAAALTVCASLLNPSAGDETWHNETMLERLFVIAYSSDEFNALLLQSRALVPFDARITFVDVPPTMANQLSPLVS